MLGGSKSHIYVSIRQGKDASSGGVYRKASHVWMLSVEPNKKHIPGLPHSPPEPVHFIAILDDEKGEYIIQTHTATADPGILGNILVTESAPATPDDVLQILNEKLKPGPSTLPSEQTSEDDPEHWIRRGLHVLQAHKTIDAFDVGEFMTYAHGYAANRAEHEAPAMVGYPGIHKDHQKKAQKQNFWVNYPMASKVSPRTGIGEKHKMYGGLM